MFSRIRSRRVAPLLALALQLWLGWTSVSILLHDDSDDPVCNPVLVLHDQNAHHFGASKARDSQPDHCFICHNLSLRSLVATTAEWSPAAGIEQLAVDSTHAGSATVIARRAARAPPLA